MMKLLHQKTLKGLFALTLFLTTVVSWGQVTLSGTSYSENFDTTPGSAGTSYPTGWTSYNGSTADATMTTGNNTSATGANYNYIRRIGLLGSSSNFATSSIVLHIGSTANKTDFKISYDVIKIREQGRSNSFNLEVSTTSATSGFTAVSAGAYASGTIAEGTVTDYNNITLPASINNDNGGVWIRWSYAEIGSGSGSRDGIALDNVVLTWTNPPTESNASNIARNSTFAEPTNIDYAQYQDASIAYTAGAHNSIEVAQFDIRDGGGSSDSDALVTSLTGITFTVTNPSALRSLALFDGNTKIAETAVNSTAGSASVAFSGFTSTLSAPDNSSKTFSLRATFKSTVTDNTQMSFRVASTTQPTSNTSKFAETNAGQQVSSTSGDANRVEVTADRLAFTTHPSNAVVGAGMANVVITARDVNNNTDADFNQSVSVTSTGMLTGSPVNVNATSGVATFNGLVHTTAGNGFFLTASNPVNSDWDTVNSNSFNITKANQTITFGMLGNVTYGDPSFTLTATGGASGEPVTYMSLDETVATVSGNTITIVGPGQTLIAASQAGNDNYSPATDVDQILTVNKKQLTITGAAAQSKTYDGTDTATITGATLTGGAVGADEIMLGAADAIFEDKNIGTGKAVVAQFSLSGAHAAKYELAEDLFDFTADITAKELTITGISIADKNFDSNTDAAITGTAELTGVVTGEDVSLGGTPTATFDNIGPGGNIPVTVLGYAITGADVANYTLTQPTGLFANILETGLDNQTITFDALNPFTYGDASFTLGATASSGLTVTYTSSDENVATVSGNTVTITGAGTVTITALQDGDSNYNPAPAVPQELIVNQKMLTVANAAVTDKIYNGGDVAEVTGTLTGIVGDDEVILDGTGQFATVDVANGIAVETLYGITGADVGNYLLTQPGSLTGNIVPAELTIVNAVATDKVYNANTVAVITGILTGIVAPDAVTFVGTGVFASPNVNNGITVTSTATLEGPDAGNYVLVQPTGLTANITSKNITVTALAENKEYDRNTTAEITITETTGAESGDDVTVTSGGTFADFLAGNNKPVTPALSLTGTDASNYTITQPTGLTADITAKNLTVASADVADKTYDGTTSATIENAVINGIVAGDENDIEIVSGTFAQETPGTGIAVSNLLLSGSAAANYTLTQPTGLTGNINGMQLTLANATATNKVYDGTTTATITGTLAGVAPGDTVTFTGAGTFASADVAQGIEVTANIVLTGPDAANYTIIQPTGLTADIMPKQLTLTGIAAENKVYDRTTVATVSGTPQATGVLNDDAVTVEGTPIATFNNYNAGLRSVSVTGYTLGGDAANYVLAEPTLLSANITPKTITAEGGEVATKVYNGNTTAQVSGVTLTGLEEGDETVVATTGTYALPDVGTHYVTLILSGAGAANYTLTQPDPLLSGTITKKNLTVTADNKTVNKGAGMPTFTVSFSGFVAGDNTSDIADVPTASVTVANTNTPGAYPITVSEGEADNYELILVNGWFIVQDVQQTNVSANPLAIWVNSVAGSSTANPYTSGQTYNATYIASPTGLGAGSGININSYSGRYGGSGWWTNANNIGTNDYFSFRLAPLSAYQIDFTSITGYWQSSNTGPKKYEVRSSIDNYASAISSGTITNNGNQSTMSIDLSSLQNVTSSTTNGIAGVEIRIYAFDAQSDSGTFSINDFTITANITQATAVPGTAAVVTSTSTDTSVFGNTDTYQITASGSPVITSFNAVGSNASGSANNPLQQGVTVNTATGLVSFDGTTPVGTHYIKVSATNYYGTGNRVVTYTVTPAPAISATPSPITTFHAYQGQGASAQVQITSVTGSNLSPTSGNINLSVTGDFEVALGIGGFNSSGSFSYSGGTVNLSDPQIYVRMKAGLAVGTYTGTLTFSGGNATYELPLEGLVETAPSITTTFAAFGPYCAGTQNNISVAYTTTGTFPSGNYYVQLSNASGVFPTDFSGIISAPSATSPIAATLPNTMTPGNYRVRVLHLSSALLLTFSLNDNGSNIAIKALPTLGSVQAGPACSGGNTTVTLTGLLASTEVTVAYNIAGNANTATITADASGNATFDIEAAYADNGATLEVISLTRNDEGSCSSAISANNTTLISVYPAPGVAGVIAAPACNGTVSVVALQGLLPDTAFEIAYSINGGATAVAEVTSDTDGEGSFEITLPAGTHDISLLNVTHTATGCTTALSGVVAEIVVNERPTAAITSEGSSLCLGAEAEIAVALTGVGPWELTYSDGSAQHEITIETSDLAGGVYALSVTPSEGATTYIVTGLTDANCTAIAADLTGSVAFNAAANYWEGDVDNDWFNAENWSCGVVPSETIAASIMNGTTQIASGQTASAETLTISGTGHLIVETGSNLFVTNAVTVVNDIDEEGIITGGQLTIQNNANLIQENDGPNINSGFVTVEKNSAPMWRLDYAMWAAPVSGETLIDFSPHTLANRFYRYNPLTDGYTTSGMNEGNVEFDKGRSYLIRASNIHPSYESNPTNPTAWEGAYVGVPNNGDVTVSVVARQNDPGQPGYVSGFNAIGNPYPSPINVYEFYTRNINNLVNGSSIFFWRKKNDADTSSYVSLTLGGLIVNSDNPWGDSSNGEFDNLDENDEWVINAGQGFIVQARTTSIVFDNDMRQGVHHNYQFRSAQDQTSTASRLWLNLKNDAGQFSQSLIAYTENTTLDIDFGWDGKVIGDGAISLYSFAGDTKLGIQARMAFDDTDEVPMGYKAQTAGNYTLSIDHVEGVFMQGQEIFLRDNLLGVTHSLTDGAYAFTTEAGTFAGRFDVVYAEALDTDIPVADPNSVIVYKNGNNINITSGVATITGVTVHDLRGRLLYSNNSINAAETVVSGLQAQEQMLIVEVATEKGKVSKKIIF
ncbi:YDG domain-containing protein [Flavobacterium sp. MFBS3-15]|uniref:YDG domain-containing protein n=1 Tax=Flavobacterium sp. MFBS3-15 TaxID=2989816 RepID=UPI0022365BAA|nr:YDG domain-containing protein [Flavobacterium sp. MFBS3-15]MCW4470277.1 YDG domain-containing protein [Flavobacterium sp. MFBS3-15]